MRKPQLVAIFAALAIAPASHAAVVAFSAVDIPIPTTFAGVYVNLETGSSGSSPAVGANINLFFGGAGISNDADAVATSPTLQFFRVGSNNNDAAKNLPLGTTIDGSTTTIATSPSANPFGSSGSPNSHLSATAATDKFEVDTVGYLGFTFTHTTHGDVFGYAKVTFNASTGGTLHGWAYETSGGPITITEPVPEPTAGLLGLFALGILALRRRR